MGFQSCRQTAGSCRFMPFSVTGETERRHLQRTQTVQPFPREKHQSTDVGQEGEKMPVSWFSGPRIEACGEWPGAWV